VARSIVAAWVLTFPMAGGMAAIVYLACRYVFQLP
jgi:PiT family inorganic phosphate transporter